MKGRKEAHEVGKDHGDDQRADKALDRLFRTELDQLVTAKEHAAHVGGDVVDDDERDRDPEPDHALLRVQEQAGAESGMTIPAIE